MQSFVNDDEHWELSAVKYLPYKDLGWTLCLIFNTCNYIDANWFFLEQAHHFEYFTLAFLKKSHGHVRVQVLRDHLLFECHAEHLVECSDKAILCLLLRGHLQKRLMRISVHQVICRITNHFVFVHTLAKTHIGSRVYIQSHQLLCGDVSSATSIHFLLSTCISHRIQIFIHESPQFCNLRFA